MKRKVAGYVNHGSANPCMYIVSLHYVANSCNMETDRSSVAGVAGVAACSCMKSMQVLHSCNCCIHYTYGYS